MKARLVGVTFLCIAAAVPLLAHASHMDVFDPVDVEGRLDIRLAKVREKTKWKFTVSTWEEWSAEEIFDRGYILVYLDTFGTQRFDYYALVRSDGTVLKGTLWRDFAAKADERIGHPRVKRPDETSARVLVSPDKLKFDADRISYSWYVETLYTNSKCRKVCFDLAPDQDSVLEPRPGITPTSSPTPSPTTSP